MRKVEESDSEKIVEKLKTPGREVELSSKVLGSVVQGQSRQDA